MSQYETWCKSACSFDPFSAPIRHVSYQFLEYRWVGPNCDYLHEGEWVFVFVFLVWVTGVTIIIKTQRIEISTLHILNKKRAIPLVPRSFGCVIPTSGASQWYCNAIQFPLSAEQIKATASRPDAIDRSRMVHVIRRHFRTVIEHHCGLRPAHCCQSADVA